MSDRPDVPEDYEPTIRIDRTKEAEDTSTRKLSAPTPNDGGSGASGEFIRDEMAFVYTAPLAHPEPRAAYWMLIAVQGMTRPLIALLSPQDAAALVELMEKSFRRSQRMPVQVELIRELRARARQ